MLRNFHEQRDMKYASGHKTDAHPKGRDLPTSLKPGSLVPDAKGSTIMKRRTMHPSSDYGPDHIVFDGAVKARRETPTPQRARSHSNDARAAQTNIDLAAASGANSARRGIEVIPSECGRRHFVSEPRGRTRTPEGRRTFGDDASGRSHLDGNMVPQSPRRFGASRSSSVGEAPADVLLHTRRPAKRMGSASAADHADILTMQFDACRVSPFNYGTRRVAAPVRADGPTWQRKPVAAPGHDDGQTHRGRRCATPRSQVDLLHYDSTRRPPPTRVASNSPFRSGRANRCSSPNILAWGS